MKLTPVCDCRAPVVETARFWWGPLKGLMVTVYGSDGDVNGQRATILHLTDEDGRSWIEAVDRKFRRAHPEFPEFEIDNLESLCSRCGQFTITNPNKGDF